MNGVEVPPLEKDSSSANLTLLLLLIEADFLGSERDRAGEFCRASAINDRALPDLIEPLGSPF